jgi:asparagine synthetase B (glutamine-hydrolysing)
MSDRDFPALTPVVWEGEAPCAPSLHLDGPLAGAIGERWGHFGLHQHDGRRHRLARDPMGVHKLFFTVDGDEVSSSPFLLELLQAGHPLERISSVPSGHAVELDLDAKQASLKAFTSLPYGDADDDLDQTQLVLAGAQIRARLEAVFRALAAALAGRTVYVTLSGGLDSTGIAALAKAALPGLRAITFSVDDGGELSEDALAAEHVAQALGLPLTTARYSRPDICDLVDDVLIYGQDYRDFNVHCALVNAALGAAIAHEHQGDDTRPVVLTGDTMNELMADYTPVEYAGRAHYELPRLPPGRVRRFLVQGLDSGDREVGVFARYGVDCIQPYALCPDAYTSLPGKVVEHDRAKQRLVRAVLGEQVPAFVYARKKARAQVGGDKVGGTLAALLDAGIDQAGLTARFAALYGLSEPEVGHMLFSGRYRYRPLLG